MSETHAIVADLFRREAGRLTALLASRVGAARIDLVEDAVQDALIAAMRSWPIHGTPANPPAWLYTAARNAMTDRLRRARFEKTSVDPIDIPTVADDRFAAEDTLSDELLGTLGAACAALLVARTAATEPESLRRCPATTPRGSIPRPCRSGATGSPRTTTATQASG